MTSTRQLSATQPASAAPTSSTLRVRLPNGVEMQIEIGSTSAVASVLSELAQLRC